MNPEDKKKLCELLKKSTDPLILIPENFDTDSVSGAVGLYLFLEKMSKKPRIACAVDIPEKFLVFVDKKIIESRIQGECLYKISLDAGENQIKELSYAQNGNILQINLVMKGSKFAFEKPRVDRLKFSYDLVFVIGSANLASLGKIYSENACFFSEAPVVNIDCRVDNKKFGIINFIRPDLSVSEILAEITGYISRNVLDSTMANLFLSGIIVKTNNFRAPNIKAETFAQASLLLRAGANREEIIKRLIGISMLVSEETEFYPSSKITKQIIDRINKQSSWHLREERKVKDFNGLKLLSLNQRIFYLVAALGAIPGIMALEGASPAMAPLIKKNENIFLEESSADAADKKNLDYISVFIGNIENAFPLPSAINFSAGQKEKKGESIDSQKKKITATLEAVKEDKVGESAAEENKSIALKKNPGKIGIPKKFSIPFLGISTNIQEVGLAPGGEMESPNNYKNVGWFNLGTRPGENGNAVVAGHFDSNLGKDGVFQNINKLNPGDHVYTTDEHGNKMRFRVARSAVYEIMSAPMEEIFGSSAKPHLNLITCDGVWDWGKKSYNKRLVVFTDYDPE